MNLTTKLTILSLLLFTLTACNKDDEGLSSSNLPCEDTNCADYTSMAAAQADFDANPDCRGDLDADNDGIACEEPGNSVTSCSNTSNCGCSGKNKSPCQADPCCKWVVGEGCECS